LGCVCLLGSNGLALLIPWFTKQAIDHLEHATTSTGLARPYFFGILIIVTAAGQMCIRIGSRWLLLGNSRKVAHDLRNDLFAHLQKLAPSYYVRTPTGDLMSRAINDMQYVQSLVGPVILYMSNTVIMYLGAIPIMLSMSTELTLLALIPYPLFLITFKRFTAVLFARSRAVQEKLGEVSSRAQESLSGMQIIKAYVQEESEAGHFRDRSEDYLETNKKLIRAHALLMPLMTVVGRMGMLVVIWVGGMRAIEGSITLGDFVAFNGYLLILAMPTAFLGMILSASQRGLSALRRINDVFDEEPTIADDESVLQFEIERGEIEIRDLSFTYPSNNGAPNHRFGLENINLKIPAGTTLAIVGHTGSGKTTLVNLISRQLELEPGNIFIDGRDITTIPLAEARRKIGMVPQESFLFSTTLRENIALGYHGGGQPQEAGMEAGEDVNMKVSVEEAAAAAGLMDDIEAFPKGLEAMIGERGINLSGGQRQRSALARALVADPKILILDDAFSSVDTHTEELILENLKGTLVQRTAVIISHRVSTVKDADNIIVIEEGRIAEQGTHDSLVQEGGIYAELYERQLLMEELEELE
jgi:ATP-binding cassette subfamily B protein